MVLYNKIAAKHKVRASLQSTVIKIKWNHSKARASVLKEV